MAGYIHRVAIANSRPITFNDRGVTFKWRDYRVKGRERYKTMTLETDKFIRRFLIRLDLLALSPTRRDQEGNPVPQFVDQLVMSPPGIPAHGRRPGPDREADAGKGPDGQGGGRSDTGRMTTNRKSNGGAPLRKRGAP